MEFNRKLITGAMVSILALVLAACQTTTEPQAVYTHPEAGMTQLGEGVTTLDLEPTIWDRAGAVEVLGVGMGNYVEVLNNPAEIEIIDVDSVTAVYLQVILKFSSEDAVVTFENSSDEVLATVDDTGTVKNTTGTFFEVMLDADRVPGDGIIRAHVNPAGEDADREGWKAPRSFVAFVLREDATPSVTSKGAIGYADIYYADSDLGRVQSYTETLEFVPAPVDRDVVISFALSEVEADERVADVEVKVGAEVVFDVRFVQSDEDEVIVRSISKTLPAGVTTITVTASSPDPADDGVKGDSFFLAGVNASVTEPPEDEEFGACTPGYWRNHTGEGPGRQANAWAPTGYATGDLFSGVFGRVITVDAPRRVTYEDPTLLQAVKANGGGVNALARSAVAALLNAAHPDVNYPYDEAAVIAAVQAALDAGGSVIGETATYFDDINNEFICPL